MSVNILKRSGTILKLETRKLDRVMVKKMEIESLNSYTFLRDEVLWLLEDIVELRGEGLQFLIIENTKFPSLKLDVTRRLI